MPDPGKVRIGISGWTYKPWRGVFYPEDLKQATTRVRIDHNILGWRIDNRPENPIVMFHDTLNALEQIVREANILPN